MFILPLGASQDGPILETLNRSFRFSHLSLPGGRLGRGEILGVSDPMNYLAPNEHFGGKAGAQLCRLCPAGPSLHLGEGRGSRAVLKPLRRSLSPFVVSDAGGGRRTDAVSRPLLWPPPSRGVQVPGLCTAPRLLQELPWTCGCWRLAILSAPFCSCDT